MEWLDMRWVTHHWIMLYRREMHWANQSLMLIIDYFANWGERLAQNNIMVSCLEAVNRPTLLLTPILHALKVFEQNMKLLKHFIII
jgi:hypothetical protein